MLVLISVILFAGICSGQSDEIRILIFSKSAGFRHSSIEAGIVALEKLAKKEGYVTEHAEDASIFKEKELKRFNTVIFLNTTGDVLDHNQQANFERFIQAGGGYMGIHAASDTEYDWEWYGRLVGAYFKSHPNIQPAILILEKSTHPATDSLPPILATSAIRSMYLSALMRTSTSEGKTARIIRWHGTRSLTVAALSIPLWAIQRNPIRIRCSCGILQEA